MEFMTKIYLIFFFFSTCQQTLSDPLSKLSPSGLKLFKKYANQLNKLNNISSMTPKEKKFRLQVFQSNLKMISQAEHQIKLEFSEPEHETHSYTTGINKFSFLTDEEFERRFLISEPIMNADTEEQRLSDDPKHSFNYFLKMVLKEVDETFKAANKTLQIANELGFDHGFGNGFSVDSIKNDLKEYMTQPEMSSTNDVFGSNLEKEFPGFSDFGDFNSGFHFRLLGNTRKVKIKTSIDWRPQFNPVFDQGDCNACYITSSLETIEAIHNKIYPNQQKIKLSIQEVLDCSVENSGCLGGQPSVVFGYVKKYGISYHKNYSYNQIKGQCRIRKIMIGNRQLQSLKPPMMNSSADFNMNMMNQSYLNLIMDIHKISQSSFYDLLKMVTPEEIEKNNQVIEMVNLELIKLNLSYSKKLEYDYIRARFFFVIFYPSSPNKEEFQDLYGFPYIPGIILLNDIQKNKAIDSSSKKTSSNFPLPDKKSSKEIKKEDSELKSFDTSDPSKNNPFSNKQNKTSNPNRYTDLENFYFIKPNVVELLKALQYGPVIIAHYVPSVFKFYKRGVFDGQGCDKIREDMVNHAAVVVGYDLNANPPYFRIRSSWGADWGEGGYYRMTIGPLNESNKGTCLIAGTSFMVFPHIKNFS
jgi:C1A family cysteine protease